MGQALPQDVEAEWAGEKPWEAPVDPDAYAADYDGVPESGSGLGVKILAGFLGLLAAAWLAAVGVALSGSWQGLDLPGWVGWIATASAPLVLLGLVWTLFGRSSRRETRRYIAAVREMRSESAALTEVLAVQAARIAENRAALGEESARLMTLGDEASERIGRVTASLSRDTAELERKAQAFDAAASAARVDIGVMMSDLPKAEEQARAAAEAMKAAGLGAHEQALGLEGQLAALAAQSRQADEAAGGAAQRLGAHLAQIESGAGAASERMTEAAAQMNAAVDGAMARAADSVDQARSGLEAQGQTMLAMIEQSRAAFEEAGADTTRGLAERLDLAGQKIEMLAGRLASQDQASRTLLANVGRQIDEIGRQIAALGESGDAQNSRLQASMIALRDGTAALHEELARGDAQSEALAGRARELGGMLAGLTGQLRDELPPAMAGVEMQAERTAATAARLTGEMAAMRDAADAAAQRTEASEASLARQRAALDALMAALGVGAREAEEKLAILARLVGETDGAAAQLIRDTGPELVETLVRVRESAAQAAAHTREAIAAVIPESVAALVEATRGALAEAASGPVREQIAEIGEASHLALATAKAAGERLTRQLLAIGETAAAIEGRIEEDREAREAREAHALSQRVSLLIDALNSTAIDVSKILSNEPADSTWAAYLKGDRSVFTRRAVRLLDSGEARAILRHYEDEPEFRDQVNRYIVDFEAMLRRVLADGQGSALGITLLSSDMGKLYVALAQAIERLRR